MYTFNWSDSFLIGVDPMDNDHKQIIKYMNELAEAAEKRHQLMSLMRPLLDYVNSLPNTLVMRNTIWNQ